ncbi:MAG: YdcF family protein [Anaerolineae bacterium]|nr:YdcF family protein [Anaerolineae bacterium]
MIELLIRTLCDIQPPVIADGAYLFGQTVDNQQSVFETGVDLLDHGLTKKLLISAAGMISGYPGLTAWKRDLVALGVDAADIIAIEPTTNTILHTLIEAESLVSYLKTENCKTVVLVSAPFHQLRCFMTVVSVALKEMPELRIYNQVGGTLPWHETVSHSQGTLQLKRSDLIESELRRIDTYQQKGDLAETQAVFNYLIKRDKS